MRMRDGGVEMGGGDSSEKGSGTEEEGDNPYQCQPRPGLEG